MEKKFNTAKNAISREKKIDLFDFTSFFAWTFLNCLARCEIFYDIPPAVSNSSQTIPLANLAVGTTCLSNVLVKRSLSSRMVLSLSSPISANASSVGAKIVKGPSI